MSDVREVARSCESTLTKPYLATWNWPGCLPDTDVLDWDTPREGWNDLIERLNEWEGMWVLDNPDDPSGPQSRSPFALRLEEMARLNQPGVVTDDDGMLYVVERSAS